MHSTILHHCYAELRRTRRAQGRKPIVYVAGPFRPKADGDFGMWANIMSAMKQSLAVWRAGGVGLCPHGNTFPFQNAAPDEVWLDGDYELMLGCDAVFMGPGWEGSSGSVAEKAFAEEWGIPIFTDLEELLEWIGNGVEVAAGIDQRTMKFAAGLLGDIGPKRATPSSLHIRKADEHEAKLSQEPNDPDMIDPLCVLTAAEGEAWCELQGIRLDPAEPEALPMPKKPRPFEVKATPSLVPQSVFAEVAQAAVKSILFEKLKRNATVVTAAIKRGLPLRFVKLALWTDASCDTCAQSCHAYKEKQQLLLDSKPNDDPRRQFHVSPCGYTQIATVIKCTQ